MSNANTKACLNYQPASLPIYDMHVWGIASSEMGHPHDLGSQCNVDDTEPAATVYAE